MPDYPPFAKRMLLDNGWFRTLTRDNVELVTERNAELTARGVRLARGAQRDLDAIVFATGFHANRFLWPIEITGAQAWSLHAHWGDDPRAYLGITVPGFPNLFCLYGPNTNLAHGGSIIFHSECQMHYIVGCLQLLFARGARALDCRPAVHDAYNARVDAAHEAHDLVAPARDQLVQEQRRARHDQLAVSPGRLLDDDARARPRRLLFS